VRPDVLAVAAPELAGSLDGAWLAGHRWYAGKGREVRRVAPRGWVRPAAEGGWLLAVDVPDGAGDVVRYALPAVVRDGALAEAGGDDPLWAALAAACLEGRRVEGEGAELLGAAGPGAPPGPLAPGSRPLGIDQSNTTVVLGERLALKCHRVLVPGAHPEIELLRALTAAGFPHVPAVRGSAELRVDGAAPAGLLLLLDLVDGRDGWLHAEEELGALLERGSVEDAAAAPLAWAPAVGAVCARLHVALARALPAGGPAPDLAARRARVLRAAEAGEPELAAAVPRLRGLLAALDRDPSPPQRVHGDLHVGQFLLRAGAPPWVVDFEGEPGAPVGERSAPDSPLRDLAALLRSVDHAEGWVLSGRAEGAEVAAAWRRAARAALVRGYAEEREALGAPLALDPAVLRAHEAAKAVDEFAYAARFLPSWLVAPRHGLRTLLEAA